MQIKKSPHFLLRRRFFSNFGSPFVFQRPQTFFSKLLPQRSLPHDALLFLRFGAKRRDRRGTVVFIQRNQTVHLTTSAYARHQTCLKACKQFGNALKQRFLPILWVLLAPTRLGEFQRILFGDYIMDLASSIHQQKLHGRSAQVNPNVIAHHSHPLS